VDTDSLYFRHRLSLLWTQTLFIVDTYCLYCRHRLSLSWTQTLFIVATDSLYCGHILSLLWTQTLFIVDTDCLCCGHRLSLFWAQILFSARHGNEILYIILITRIEWRTVCNRTILPTKSQVFRGIQFYRGFPP